MDGQSLGQPGREEAAGAVWAQLTESHWDGWEVEAAAGDRSPGSIPKEPLPFLLFKVLRQ